MRSTAHRILLLTFAASLLTTSAMAQFIAFPRIGVSASPTEQVSEIDVHGSETFELYVIALPPENEPVFQHDYGVFQWVLLEACCGGSAELVDETFNPACEHEGGIYSGVISSAEECMDGSVAWLCTLTLRMATDDPGRYYVIAAPAAQAVTCAGEDVVMTDMLVNVNYTTDTTPAEATSLSAVKGLFD